MIRRLDEACATCGHQSCGGGAAAVTTRRAHHRDGPCDFVDSDGERHGALAAPPVSRDGVDVSRRRDALVNPPSVQWARRPVVGGQGSRILGGVFPGQSISQGGRTPSSHP
ncbi:hypothetical protein OPAG_05116 [Rhodococcus opacus PD630]|nr:hypothetical protein Pd630_LPD04564 [Rhodococcus opacus PD630]EHI45082.1 hypothetical protein OPAG_05116 [Rhodococcus opacus PD630]